MKGSGAPAEIRRNPALLHRPAFRIHLLVQFAGQDQILQHAELLFAAGQLALQLVDHGREAGNLRRLAICGLAAALRRRFAEVEFPVVQIRHPRQAPAQRIEPDDVRVHLADPHRERIDLVLQYPPQVVDLRFLMHQFSGPAAQLVDGIGGTMSLTQAHADRESAPDDPEYQRQSRHDHQRLAQIELLDAARLAADEDDVHLGISLQRWRIAPTAQRLGL